MTYVAIQNNQIVSIYDADSPTVLNFITATAALPAAETAVTEATAPLAGLQTAIANAETALATAEATLATAQAAVTEPHANLLAAQVGVDTATRALGAATHAVSDAQAAIAAATAALIKANALEPPDAEAVAAANTLLTTAQTALTEAQAAIAEPTATLATAQAGLTSAQAAFAAVSSDNDAATTAFHAAVEGLQAAQAALVAANKTLVTAQQVVADLQATIAHPPTGFQEIADNDSRLVALQTANAARATAQGAQGSLDAAIALGLVLTSTGTSALNGTYACDADAQAEVMAEVAYLNSTGGADFSNGLATIDWTDAAGGDHTFDPAHFVPFAQAMARYVTGCKLAARANAKGGSVALPSNAATIV